MHMCDAPMCACHQTCACDHVGFLAGYCNNNQLFW